MRSSSSRAAFGALLVAAVGAAVPAQQRSIDDFFTAFTADWIRQDPNQAASTRFFTGDEQQRFERQITPLTPEWRRARVALAERSLAELTRIENAATLSESQRLSADLMRWQLDSVIRSSRYEDYFFPFEQVIQSSRRPTPRITWRASIKSRHASMKPSPKHGVSRAWV